MIYTWREFFTIAEKLAGTKFGGFAKKVIGFF